MAYATALQVAQASGLGVRVVDENVGTGNSSEKDFDLDYDNIVSGSCVLSSAPVSGDTNTFTALTETTHYTLDKESGRISLTAAGVTALGTNYLFASYTYIDGGINDTLLTQWLAWADDEVYRLTSQRWGTPASYSEYFDGRKVSGYPKTDRPYEMVDWDAPQYIVLSNRPVTGINYVHILANNSLLNACFSYDASLTTYTDNTDESNESEGTAFYAFATTPANGDILYIGCSSKFHSVQFILATAGVTPPTVAWTYYNGTTWASFTPTDNTVSLTMNGTVTYNPLPNWQTVSVNSSTPYYFIRASINGAYGTSPSIHELVLKDVVSNSVPIRSVEWESYGKLNFTGYGIPDGTRNVLINYNAGYTSVPVLVSELAADLVSLRAYVYITGGSFDDVTSAQLGSKSVSVGEPYMNLREALSMTRDRVKEIVRLIGARYDVVSSN